MARRRKTTPNGTPIKKTANDGKESMSSRNGVMKTPPKQKPNKKSPNESSSRESGSSAKNQSSGNQTSSKNIKNDEGRKSHFPTQEEIIAAIPPEGINIKTLCNIFRTRVGDNKQQFLKIVKALTAQVLSVGPHWLVYNRAFPERKDVWALISPDGTRLETLLDLFRPRVGSKVELFETLVNTLVTQSPDDPEVLLPRKDLSSKSKKSSSRSRSRSNSKEASPGSGLGSSSNSQKTPPRSGSFSRKASSQSRSGLSSSSKKTPPRSGSVSSSQSTESASGDGWVKKKGRLIDGGDQINPTGIHDGKPLKRFPEVKTPTSKGFYNAHSLCYRNSILQALLHVPAFYRYLGNIHQNCGLETTDCVVCVLQLLVHRYWNDESTANKDEMGFLVDLFDAVCSNNLPEGDKTFETLVIEMVSKAQSDAVDFLHWLLTEHVEKSTRPSDRTTYSSLFTVDAEVGWTCEDCNSRSVSTTPIQSKTTIDVNIAEPKVGLTLVEYLRHIWTGEKRTTYCDSDACQLKYPRRLRDGPVRELSTKFKRMPEVLMIRLIRFTTVELAHDPVTGKRKVKTAGNGLATQKFLDQVPYEEHLNLTEFMVDSDGEEETIYRLDAVVMHIGATIQSGHYIAAAREQDGRKFVTIDDDKSVGPSLSSKGRGTIGELTTPARGQTYILFYSKL